MEKIESMANIDKIVFAIQNNTNAGFFFIPWVGCNYEKGLKGKKVLVVGASHYCKHSNLCKNPFYNNKCSNFSEDNKCLLGCNYFQKCTVEHSASKCNELCSYMKTECHSVLYIELCNAIKLQIKYQIANKLNSTTLDEVCYFLDSSCYDNYSFTKFSNFNSAYFERDKVSLWKHIAFVNYAQSFQPESTGNSFDDSDYEVFKKYIELLKPDVVIVWGEVGNELYNRGFKKDTRYEGYVWEREGIIYLHSYHPSYSGYEHCGKLTEAMNKVFD